MIDSNESAKLLIQNIAHFAQAEVTLFTTQTMKKIIDIYRCALGVNEILSGHFSPPKTILSSLQLNYIHFLQLKNKINPKRSLNKINIEDIKVGSKIWKEKRSISSFNRHLDHYKLSLATNGLYKKESNNKSNII